MMVNLRLFVKFFLFLCLVFHIFLSSNLLIRLVGHFEFPTLPVVPFIVVNNTVSGQLGHVSIYKALGTTCQGSVDVVVKQRVVGRVTLEVIKNLVRFLVFLWKWWRPHAYKYRRKKQPGGFLHRVVVWESGLLHASGNSGFTVDRDGFRNRGDSRGRAG
jgi:hypothetical protein